jgi:hypothetical protein
MTKDINMYANKQFRKQTLNMLKSVISNRKYQILKNGQKGNGKDFQFGYEYVVSDSDNKKIFSLLKRFMECKRYGYNTDGELSLFDYGWHQYVLTVDGTSFLGQFSNSEMESLDKLIHKEIKTRENNLKNPKPKEDLIRKAEQNKTINFLAKYAKQQREK